MWMSFHPPRGGGGTPLYGLYRYVRPKGYGFLAVLVRNRVSTLATLGTLVLNWVCFLEEPTFSL